METDKIKEIKSTQSSAIDFSKNLQKRFDKRIKDVKQKSIRLLEDAKIIKDTGGFEGFTQYNQLHYRKNTSKFLSDLQGIITDIKVHSGHDVERLKEVETIAEDVLKACPYLHADVREGYTADLAKIADKISNPSSQEADKGKSIDLLDAEKKIPEEVKCALASIKNHVTRASATVEILIKNNKSEGAKNLYEGIKTIHGSVFHGGKVESNELKSAMKKITDSYVNSGTINASVKAIYDKIKEDPVIKRFREA